MESHFSFQGFHQTGWLIASVFALGLSGACIWILYRYERQLIVRSVGWWLLALRLVVLLLIFVILLQPVISWSFSEAQRSRLAIAIDLSESMQTRDEHATLAEQLHWARALGMIGGAGNRDEIDRWIQESENGTEPDWATVEEEPNPDRRSRLAESRRENVMLLTETLQKLRRVDLVEKILTETSQPLLDELSELYSLDLQLFAGGRKEFPQTL